MLAGDNELEQIYGVLHDVIEDTDITFEYLREEGFTTLYCLTKRKDESYDDFIERIIANKTACQVKLADLNDNMDL